MGKTFLSILIVYIGFISFSQQSIEESEYNAFIEKIDSLKENKLYLEANELCYEYSTTLYLHNYYASANRSAQLTEIRNELAKLIDSYVSNSDKVKYYRDKADRFIENANYKKALYALLALPMLDSTLNVESEIHDLKLRLPTDTVKEYDGHILQLFHKGGHPNIDKSSKYYLYRDSSLFSGVIIRKHKVSSEVPSALLKYEHYADGLLTHTRSEYYLPTNQYHANKVFEFQDSSRFWLASTSTYHSVDGSSSTMTFYQTGTIKQINRGFNTPDSRCELSIAFNPSGDTISYAETTHKTMDGDTTNVSYTLNQYGDTTGISLSYSHGDDFITSDCSFNAKGDTISCYKTLNGILDGLEISQFFDESESAYYKRIIWDEGTLINVEIENAIFIGKNDNVVDKAQFIDYVNSISYHDVYIEPTVDLPSSINKSGYHFLVSVDGIYNAHFNYKKGYKKILKQQLKLDKKLRKN